MEDALLHLELASKSENVKLASDAFYLTARVFIDQLNFSEAHIALNKANERKLKSKKLKSLGDFVDGVILIQKGKVKKGCQLITELLDTLGENDPLIQSALIYRSYGFVAIEKYEQAVEDIKRIKNSSDIVLYNKNLSKGILRMDNEDYLMASKYFGDAWKLFPKIKDAYCL